VIELYLIFFGVGLLLFGGIVAYSLLQKRSEQLPPREEYVDPLFAELEEQKGRKKSIVEAPGGQETVADEAVLEKQRRAEEPVVEASTAGQTDDSGASNEALETSEELNLKENVLTPESDPAPEQKREPSLEKPSSPSQPVPDAPTANEPSLHSDSVRNAGESDVAKDSDAPKAPPPQRDQDTATVVTELVARVKNPSPIEQQGLLSLFRKHDFKFHRKVHIYGLNELTDMWRDIEFELPSARFTELGISIQLADREGAMTKKELHDFQQMVLEFTNVYDAPFEFSMNIDEALVQASALDKIGRRYDSMAVLNVVPKSKSGFRMADIESCARDLMMSTDKNGIFMKTRGHKSNMSILFRLACTDGSGQFGVSSSAAPVHDLVVYMNVPATEDPERVFQDMVKDANSLASWLEGKVVDRAGRVMTQRSYSMLMQQVSDIAFSMQQDGLIPGDAISQKLF